MGRQIKSPLDIERDLGMIGGRHFSRRPAPRSVLFNAPDPGYASYKMPAKNLFLCGSGAHPGGGVTGLPGRNAAEKMLHSR